VQQTVKLQLLLKHITYIISTPCPEKEATVFLHNFNKCVDTGL